MGSYKRKRNQDYHRGLTKTDCRAGEQRCPFTDLTIHLGGPGELAQWLRVLAALLENKGTIPSTHMVAQNSISRRPDNLFCPRYAHKIIQKILNNSSMSLYQPGPLRTTHSVLEQAGCHSTLSVAGYTSAILELSRLRLALAM